MIPNGHIENNHKMSRATFIQSFAKNYELQALTEGSRFLQPVDIDSACTNVNGIVAAENIAACTSAIREVVLSVVRNETEADSFLPKASSDANWLIITGTLVFFMHAGFSMLEAGSVRRPNVINIMFKNIGTVVLGALAYWAVGFGFAYGGDFDSNSDGENGFIGLKNLGFTFNENDDAFEAFFFFQFTFAVTAATIVSGAVAERINLEAYFVIAVFITAIVFPIATHWVWSTNGFMSAYNPNLGGALIDGSIGLIDFAGSGVVHTTGGTIALVGAYLIGPRAGRFVDEEVTQFGVASFTLQTLGTFILWFGWYGFNPGSTLVFDGVNSAKAAVTTTLAPSAAGLVGIIYTKLVWGDRKSVV